MASEIDFSLSQQYSREYMNFNLVGMTWPMERSFLHWYSKNLFQNKGEIIDLGSWFGSTVAPLARGLSESNIPENDRKKCIHAYDRFKWVPSFDYANTTKRAGWVGKYQPGQSFLSEFQEIIEPWKESIVIHVGDILQHDWSGRPVEFMHIDAMKSWDLTRKIIQEFFPFLIENVSFMAHQDFAHYGSPWIHLAMYRFKEYLKPVYHVPGTCTVIFQCAKKLTSDLACLSLEPEEFSKTEVDEAFAYSMGLVPPAKKSCIAACKAMHYLTQRQLELAQEVITETERQKLPQDDTCPCIDPVKKAIRVNRESGFDSERHKRLGY